MSQFIFGHAYVLVFLLPAAMQALAAVRSMFSLLLCQQALTGLEDVLVIVVVPVHIIMRCGADNHSAHAEPVYRFFFAGYSVLCVL